MAYATYRVRIPEQDNLKQPLVDLALLAHRHLVKHGIDGCEIEKGKRGFWKDYPEEPMTHLVTDQPDTPYNDSVFKQLGQHLGDIANQEAIYITKHGKGAPEPWLISNKNFRPGEGAQPEVLAPSIEPPQAPVSPIQASRHNRGTLCRFDS